jgi:general secretion pathway protein D
MKKSGKTEKRRGVVEMRTYLLIGLFVASPLVVFGAEKKQLTKEDVKAGRKLIDQMSEDQKDEQRKLLTVADRKKLSEIRFRNAQRLYEDMLYTEARRESERAVELNPSSREAKELLGLINSILAVRIERIRTMTQHLSRTEQVKRQEELIRLQNHLDRAKVLISQATSKGGSDGEGRLTEEVQMLDKADGHLVKAREIAKWMPAYVPVKQFEAGIESMLDRVFRERKSRSIRLDSMGKIAAAQEADTTRARTKSYRNRRIRMLIDKAYLLFDRQDYAEAGRLAKRILEMDATNTEAVQLKVLCRIKEIDKRDSKVREIKKEAVKSWVEISTRATIPFGRVLVYPENWRQVARRQSLAERRLQEPEWQKALRRALEREVSLQFNEQPLEECIHYLRGLADDGSSAASIIMDPKAFGPGGVDSQTPITLKLSKTRLGLALRWILRMAKLDYAMKDGAIFISTPDRLKGELQQKIYDVRDLTFQIQSFPGPEVGVGGLGGGNAGVVMNLPTTEIVAAGTLEDMIKRVVRPSSWDGEASITEKSGKLIVVHQPEVHNQIEQLLEDFRKSQTMQVFVEARYIDVQQGFLEEIGVDWGGNPGVQWTDTQAPIGGSSYLGTHPGLPGGNNNARYPGIADSNTGLPDNSTDRINQLYTAYGQSRSTGSSLSGNYYTGEGLATRFTYLGNWQAQVMVRAIKKEQRGTVLFAPRITMFNNQRAHMFVGLQRSYISGWSSSGSSYAPEITSAIVDGVALDVRPIVSHDRRYITLELRPSLVRPVDISNQPILGNNDPGDPSSTGNTNLSVTLPELEIRTIKTVVTVPDGGTVLLSGLMSEKQSEQQSGIPFLMDLPVIGRLFSNNFKDVERRNLLILVNARIILFSEEEQKL